MRHISAAEAERIINTIGKRLADERRDREILELIDGPVHVNRVTAEYVGRTPREPNWTDAYKVGDVVEVSLDAGHTFDRGYAVEHVEARNFKYVSARRSDGGRAVFCHDPGIIRHLRSSAWTDAWTDAYKVGDEVEVRGYRGWLAGKVNHVYPHQVYVSGYGGGFGMNVVNSSDIRHLRPRMWTDAYKAKDPVWVRLRDFDGKWKTFEATVEYVFEDRKSLTVLVAPSYAAHVEDPAKIWKRGTFPRGRNGGY